MDTSEIQENLPLRDEARVGWIDTMVSPQGSVAMDITIHAKVIFAEGYEPVKGIEVIRLLVAAEETVLRTFKFFAADLKSR